MNPYTCFLSALDLDQYRGLAALLAYFSSFITAIHQHTTCSRCSSYQRREEKHCWCTVATNAGNTTQVLRFFRDIFLSFSFFFFFLVQDYYWNHVGSVNCLLANVWQKNKYWLINNITNISGYLMVSAAFRYWFPYWSWMSAACLTLTQKQRARSILICAVWRLTRWCILAYQLQQKWSKTQLIIDDKAVKTLHNIQHWYSPFKENIAC